MECEWDPSRGERLGPAWDRIKKELRDGEWNPWTEVVSVIEPGSGLQAKTVRNLLHDGVRHGYLATTGRYPNRRVVLVNSPAVCSCGLRRAAQ